MKEEEGGREEGGGGGENERKIRVSVSDVDIFRVFFGLFSGLLTHELTSGSSGSLVN